MLMVVSYICSHSNHHQPFTHRDWVKCLAQVSCHTTTVCTCRSRDSNPRPSDHGTIRSPICATVAVKLLFLFPLFLPLPPKVGVKKRCSSKYNHEEEEEEEAAAAAEEEEDEATNKVHYQSAPSMCYYIAIQ